MNYNPNAPPYPYSQPYGAQPYPGQYQAPYPGQGVEYTQTTTTYVQQVPPPVTQVNEVVVVEERRGPSFDAGTAVIAGVAGMAMGMALEEALDDDFY